MGREANHEQLVEELRGLLDAIAERAEDYLRGCRPDGADGCGWCPVCAAVALVRGQRPEVAARLTEHVAGLLQALRQVLAEQAAEPAAEEEPDEEQEKGKVQRISVRRVDGSVLREPGNGADARC
ncbi:hypothetical protein ACFQ16_08385 [Saccharopolyspora rosea]|uniref:Uncharacterized protein n=1 Tax=Saccharopolyspora rosea TaxID=524884 RepID=A0ABW3FQ87_9PSEU